MLHIINIAVESHICFKLNRNKVYSYVPSLQNPVSALAGCYKPTEFPSNAENDLYQLFDWNIKGTIAIAIIKYNLLN